MASRGCGLAMERWRTAASTRWRITADVDAERGGTGPKSQRPQRQDRHGGDSRDSAQPPPEERRR